MRDGTTRSVFADEIGVTERTLGSYERGENQPSSGVLERISSARGVDLNWLITGEGRRPLQIDNRGMADRLAIAFRDDSVADVALKTSIDAETLRGYIGGRKPTLEHLRTIAQVSDVSLTWLATGEGAPHEIEAQVEISAEMARKLDMKEQYVKAILYRLYEHQLQRGRFMKTDNFYFMLSMVHGIMVEEFKGEDASFTDMEPILKEYVDKPIKSAKW